MKLPIGTFKRPRAGYCPPATSSSARSTLGFPDELADIDDDARR